MDLKSKFKKNRDYIFIFAIIFGCINLLLTCDAYRGTEINAENAAKFGDFLSGYFGTAINLISVLLLIITLKNQREIRSEEGFENRFFELLKIHRENVQDIGIDEKFGRRIFVTLVREFRTVREIVSKINRDQQDKHCIEDVMNISYLAFYYGIGTNSNRILKAVAKEFDPNFIDLVISEMIKRKERNILLGKKEFTYNVFEGHQSRLGHYFRHLYQSFKYVDEAKIDIDKYEFAKKLRAQLSTHEQALLFYNSLSKLGKPWKIRLINEYKLIKNLPEEFINSVDEIDPKKVYKDIVFEWEENIKAG